MSNKEKLLQLEKEGKYLFHGSPLGSIKYLEPRQARHIPDISKPDETILDGSPAVCATPYAEFAIFMSIINRNNTQFDFNSGFGINNNTKYFRVSSKEVLDSVKDKTGFVYVFNRDEFEPYSREGVTTEDSMEWRSCKEVSPVDVIEVQYSDLISEYNIRITG